MGVQSEVVAYGGTQQFPFRNVGIIDATTGNADGALDETERDFKSANALANCVSIAVETSWSSIEIRAIFATNNEDAIFDIYGVRKSGLYMARICTVTSKAGQQYANAGGSLVFADILTVTNKAWPATIYEIIPGTDHMARINLDAWGWNKLLFHGYNPVDEDIIIEIAGVS
jgi:hypothetical protein